MVCLLSLLNNCLLTHKLAYMVSLTLAVQTEKTAEERNAKARFNYSLKSNLKSSTVGREILPGRLEV